MLFEFPPHVVNFRIIQITPARGGGEGYFALVSPYVSWEYYQMALSQILGDRGPWYLSFDLIDIRTERVGDDKETDMYHVAVLCRLHILGDPKREFSAIGAHSSMDYTVAIKAAQTSAIKKVCAFLGIGLALYSMKEVYVKLDDRKITKEVLEKLRGKYASFLENLRKNTMLHTVILFEPPPNLAYTDSKSRGSTTAPSKGSGTSVGASAIDSGDTEPLF